jgi:reverse gyrase
MNNDTNYVVLPTEPLSRQLVDRIRSLERQLVETRDALKAAEERENVLILDRLRTEGGL